MDIHRPAGRPGSVQLASQPAGPRVEPGVVGRLVGPGGPDDHRWPVAVAEHHVGDVLQDEVPPLGAADILPAGRLLPDHHAEFVASVEEMRGLRIMRAAHHVAVQLEFEDLRVPALQSGGGGHAGIREELMAIEAEDLQSLAVQVETARLEHGLPEAGPDRHGVGPSARMGQGQLDGVELRLGGRPQGHLPDPGHGQPDDGAARTGDPYPGRRAGQPAGSIQQLRCYPDRARRHHRSIHGGLHLHPPPGGQHVGRPGEHVGQEHLGHDPQGHVTVDTARLQVVDGGGAAWRAVGRHVQPAGVHDDREHVVTIDEMPGQLVRPG